MLCEHGKMKGNEESLKFVSWEKMGKWWEYWNFFPPFLPFSIVIIFSSFLSFHKFQAEILFNDTGNRMVSRQCGGSHLMYVTIAWIIRLVRFTDWIIHAENQLDWTLIGISKLKVCFVKLEVKLSMTVYFIKQNTKFDVFCMDNLGEPYTITVTNTRWDTQCRGIHSLVFFVCW